MTYRSRRGSDTWHFCRNCSNWPSSDYDVRHRKPTGGGEELCDQCLAKQRAGNCRSS